MYYEIDDMVLMTGGLGFVQSVSQKQGYDDAKLGEQHV
jgi:hypothetical protein